jgi:hypothetical protein
MMSPMALAWHASTGLSGVFPRLHRFERLRIRQGTEPTSAKDCSNSPATSSVCADSADHFEPISKIRRMSWIRRRARNAEPPADRLPDLEFLALVKASLEEFAPAVTQGTELKGNSPISPRGCAIDVAPPHHGGGRHYDLVALPDVSVQPDVPCFLDCVVAMTENPRRAADTWVQTAGGVRARRS